MSITKKAARRRLSHGFCDSLSFFHVVHADLDGLHVERDELVGALRQGVAQTLFDVLVVDDGTELQESTQDDHVEHLAVTHVGGKLSTFDGVDVNVLTGGLVSDTVGVINQVATGFHFALELVE